jgi:lipopolysaccharide/colanic/teichoic acid biosynthesis glycosyltransferase
MYKFRTMVVDQADRLDGGSVDLTAPFFKLSDDPRLTRVGRWARSSSLDELPQLWHVLRGQLSLVGPRPLPAEQVLANSNMEEMQVRHEVRAGMTGWWQVNGRSVVTPQEALRMDVFYINNWSFALDVFILLKTVGAVVAGRGAQ